MKKYASVLPLLGASAICMGSTALAAPNPASADWVLNQIAIATAPLTAADWAAACDTGTPTESSGCYANAGSPKFAKLNRIIAGGGYTDLFNIASASVDNSLFIKQFNGGAAQTFSVNGTYLGISVAADSPGTATCQLFTTGGVPVGYYPGYGYTEDDGFGGYYTESIAPGGTETEAFEMEYAAGDYSGAGSAVTYFLLCIGSNVQTSPTIAALTGLSGITTTST